MGDDTLDKEVQSDNTLVRVKKTEQICYMLYAYSTFRRIYIQTFYIQASKHR